MKHDVKVFPATVIDDGTVSVWFSDELPSQSIEVKCTVDLTDFGEMIGVEVLDWHNQLSGAVLDAPSAFVKIRWSYDEEVDAFYLHLVDGRGQIQRSVVGKVGIDSNRRVVLLEVPIPFLIQNDYSTR